GVRIEEAIALQVQDLKGTVLHVRRSHWNGDLYTPKTEAGIREVDLHPSLTVTAPLPAERSRDGRSSPLLLALKPGSGLSWDCSQSRAVSLLSGQLYSKLHMPRGALNTEGSKNQNPRPFAQTARDKDGVPGLLSFTSLAATPAAQDLRGGSTQRAGRSVHRYVR